MIDLRKLLLYSTMNRQSRQDPLRANLALFAGMKRHSLAVKPLFYVSAAKDEALGRRLHESGMAIWFAGQVFDAAGHFGWPAIQRGARARLDAAFTALAEATPGGTTLGLRQYLFSRSIAMGNEFYHDALARVDEEWIIRAEIGTGLALVPDSTPPGGTGLPGYA